MAARYGTCMDTNCMNMSDVVIARHWEEERNDLIMAAARTSTSSVGSESDILAEKEFRVFVLQVLHLCI